METTEKDPPNRIVVVRRNLPRHAGLWFTALPQMVLKITSWFTEDCDIVEVRIGGKPYEPLAAALPACNVGRAVDVRVEPRGAYPRVAAFVAYPEWPHTALYGIEGKEPSPRVLRAMEGKTPELVPTMLGFRSTPYAVEDATPPQFVAPRGATMSFEGRAPFSGRIRSLTIDADLPLEVVDVKVGSDSLFPAADAVPVAAFKRGAPLRYSIGMAQAARVMIANPSEAYCFVREIYFEADFEPRSNSSEPSGN